MHPISVEEARKVLERLKGRYEVRKHVSADGTTWSCCQLRNRLAKPIVWTGERHVLLSRVVLTVKLDRPLEKWALHICDNELCVSAHHLYEGDGSQNAADRFRRNRVSEPWFVSGLQRGSDDDGWSEFE